MPPDETLKKKVARKLTKRRKDDHHVTMDIPEKFRDGDDADEDVTAPKGSNAYMNQSVFGMIAAAGSQVDFNARFEGQSSSDEDEGDGEDTAGRRPAVASKSHSTTQQPKDVETRTRLSDSKLFRSIPYLKSQNSKTRGRSSLVDPAQDEADHAEDKSLSDVPASDVVKTVSRGAPVMSQMLEAKAELDQRPSLDLRRDADDTPLQDRGDTVSSSNLARRLMEIFDFEQPEEVIEEYPCWLLNSVLLQGYMYITSKHICFYAYLPKKSNDVTKSGHLSKRGKQNPKYNRYWFRLKGDVLSYYTDPSDLYFPHGNIDLRYGISAHVAEKEKGKDATHFTVVTHNRKYYFKADSALSAKEWVKSLQKIIFRSHNEGDSVKISLPIDNVIDVESSNVVDFAETCKIRVIDNDETYAIDEYFFSFFSFGKEALNVLHILVEDTVGKHVPEDVLSHPTENQRIRSPARRSSRRRSAQLQGQKLTIEPHRSSSPALEESVRATLSPLRSPSPSRAMNSRASGEFMRSSFDGQKAGRHSVDLGRTHMTRDRGSMSLSTSRRSLSRNRFPEKPSEVRDSSDSYSQSMDDPTNSIVVASASDADHSSGSQILQGSDHLFQPTIRRSASASRRRDQNQSLQSYGSPSADREPGSLEGKPPAPRHAQTTGHIAFAPHNEVEIATTPTLQTLVKAGAYPLQRAVGFADYLNRHSKRVSNMLATESMGYVEKVSGMWKGGKKHYDEPAGMDLEDEDTVDSDDHAKTTQEHYCEHFALPDTEKLQATYFGYLHRVLPLYGKIYVSDRSFCFRSMLPGTRTKLILPLKDIENVDKEKGFRFGYHGLVIVIKGHEEIFFEFGQVDTRDDCAVTLLQNLESMKYLKESGLLSLEEKTRAENAIMEHRALQEARMEEFAEHELKLPKTAQEAGREAPPILFDDPRASILNFKPTESMRITCLTIGSRGDVQPYIALCKGLLAEGHKPRIATHLEFKDWVLSHGIDFKPVDGDPAELMRICVENGMFTYSFLKEASSTFRGWIDDLLTSSWAACQDSDLLIESPSAMAGIHIAEALGIPYFRAFTMPWTRTRAYPHAFAVPEHKMGGAYNYITYVMFDNVFWKAIAGQVNRWRKKELHLSRTNLEKMQPNKVPFLYNFSPSVVVPPLDYSDWIRVTGYWFLDEGTNFTPPKDLETFIKKARQDNKKLVYVGFGSIVVSDSAALTKMVVDSVLKADVRCILSKGWSDRLDKKGATDAEVPLPDAILQIKSVPHDWLFTQIDAAAHHGGAGTTGASLRAGLPTIVKPFFGDQFFFGSRLEDLGVGIYLRKLNVSVFSRALWEATNSERMIVKARVLGEQIRQENGVDTAIQAIYRDLEYAKTLIKRKDGKGTDDTIEESEESWTFIGDDNDPELVKRIHDWDSTSYAPSRLSFGGEKGLEASRYDGGILASNMGS